MPITTAEHVYSTIGWSSSFLWEFPLSWRRVDGRKALVGEYWCSLDYPWIVRHVPPLPEDLQMYLFNGIEKHTILSCHYSTWTCRGLQKLIGPYKYLDGGTWARVFPVLLPVRVGHWGKRKQAAQVVGRLPARHYKELPPVGLPSQCCCEQVETSWGPGPHLLWTEGRRRSAQRLSSLLVGVSCQTLFLDYLKTYLDISVLD